MHHDVKHIRRGQACVCVVEAIQYSSPFLVLLPEASTAVSFESIALKHSSKVAQCKSKTIS